MNGQQLAASLERPIAVAITIFWPVGRLEHHRMMINKMQRQKKKRPIQHLYI